MTPLIGLALNFLPELIGAVAGQKVGELAGAVTKVTKEVLGTEDRGEAEAKLAADPALQAVYIERLKAETEQFRAALADIADARQQTIQLTQAGSPIAWGAPVVSLVIVLGFLAVVGIWMFNPPSGNPAALAVLNNLVGFLGAGFAAVCNYWLGSSAGSAAKDAALRAATGKK